MQSSDGKFYKTDVADKMIEMQKKLQEQIKKQMAEQQQQENSCTDSEQCKECIPECDCNVPPTEEDIKGPKEKRKNDVVLPSEREGSVIKFPTKKK